MVWSKRLATQEKGSLPYGGLPKGSFSFVAATKESLLTVRFRSYQRKTNAMYVNSMGRPVRFSWRQAVTSIILVIPMQCVKVSRCTLGKIFSKVMRLPSTIG